MSSETATAVEVPVVQAAVESAVVPAAQEAVVDLKRKPEEEPAVEEEATKEDKAPVSKVRFSVSARSQARLTDGLVVCTPLPTLPPPLVVPRA